MQRPQHQYGTLGHGINSSKDLLEFIDANTMLMHTADEKTTDFGGCMVNVLCGEELKNDFLSAVRNRLRFSQHSGDCYKISIIEGKLCSIVDIRQWIGNGCEYEQGCGFMALVKHFGIGEIQCSKESLTVKFDEAAANELSGYSFIAATQREQRSDYRAR